MVYEPREDSVLLQKIVEKYSKGNVLDVGTGPQAIQAVTAQKNKNVNSIVAIDIDIEAIKFAKKNVKEKANFKIIQSNLFENIKDSFDTIIFNPPYLPDEPKAQDIALDGGKKGYELTIKFLEQAVDHLTKDGQILLLISTLTNPEIIEQTLQNLLLDFEIVSEEKLDFERLYVYKIIKTKELKELHDKKITSINKFSQGKRGFIFTGVLDNKKEDIKVQDVKVDVKVAIKIQRPDSGAKESVNHEARILEEINKENIGPKLIFSGDNYFVYYFIEGKFIEDALKTMDSKQAKAIFEQLIDQMYSLDKLQIEKEEMTHPQKHIIVDVNNKVYLIDFERARKTETPSNVTQCLQYISGLLDLDRNVTKILAQIYKKSYENKDFLAIKEYVLEYFN